MSVHYRVLFHMWKRAPLNRGLHASEVSSAFGRSLCPWVCAGEVSDAGDVLQALWDAAGGVWDPKRVPGQEEVALVKAAFFVHVAERVVCEPCGNKVTHTKDFYEQVICASATSIRRCHQVRSPTLKPPIM